MATGIKPYPSCRYGHAGIDAVLALRTEYDLKPGEVESITYGLSRSGLLPVCAPIEATRNPANLVVAHFRAPFVLSTALVTGRLPWCSYKLLDVPAIRPMLPNV